MEYCEGGDRTWQIKEDTRKLICLPRTSRTNVNKRRDWTQDIRGAGSDRWSERKGSVNSNTGTLVNVTSVKTRPAVPKKCPYAYEELRFETMFIYTNNPLMLTRKIESERSNVGS
jgi:hypothetical protein